jgi:hypothetical protein
MKEIVKKLAFRYTSIGAPHYPYCLEPIQLAALINAMDSVAGISGNVLEVGVARGMTTRFLCEHIVREEREAEFTYYALDTFSSFTKQDVEFEVKNRGKPQESLRGFGYNDYQVWKKNFEQFDFVTAIQGDCSSFDYSTIAPLKLTFLDVDLYRPTYHALPKIYEQTVAGGIILVDDVQDKSIYDGAYEAYMQYCREANITPEVIGNRCGIIRKK